MLDFKYKKIVDGIDFALQPVVSCATGQTIGVEALLRGYDRAFSYFSIRNLFDDAAHEGVLYNVDIWLRKKAFEKYRSLDIKGAVFFYNLDNRLMSMPDFKQGNTDRILQKEGLDKGNIVYEVAHSRCEEQTGMKNIIQTYCNEGFGICIDSFGAQHSNLHTLYFARPRFVKIDGFLIKNIQKDLRKKIFLQSVIDMCHSLGITTVVKSIETKAQYLIAKELGADCVQGFFIQKPQKDIKKIQKSYAHIQTCNKDDKREDCSSQIPAEYINTDITALDEAAGMHKLFSYFKQHPHSRFAPIIDSAGRLRGVIHEVDIKRISYSQYGMALAKNDSFGAKMSSYIKPCLQIEKNRGIDKALQVYNQNRSGDHGIFITVDEKYYGFVDVSSLLELSYKRNLQIAQNQNPLTKLPGNEMIERFLARIEKSTHNTRHIVYFDFNDFKPFNDAYGFRQGDRAILLFSDLFKKHLGSDIFKAHIGGDDFFAGFEGMEYEHVFLLVEKICRKFEKSASSLYKQKDRQKGWIKAKDRFGIERTFSLLSVGAAILEIPVATEANNINTLMSGLKKASKQSAAPVGACRI
ncbi:MAG: EAL domain-containing protein [Campylobacterota bacterium]